MSAQGSVVAFSVLFLAFIVWLWCYAPGAFENDAQKWLAQNGLTKLKNHDMLKGLKSLSDLAALDPNTFYSIDKEEKVILERGVLKLKLEVWLEKHEISAVKYILSDLGVNSLGDLCGFKAVKRIEEKVTLQTSAKFKSSLKKFQESECVGDAWMGTPAAATSSGFSWLFWTLLSVLFFTVVVLLIALVAVSVALAVIGSVFQDCIEQVINRLTGHKETTLQRQRRERRNTNQIQFSMLFVVLGAIILGSAGAIRKFFVGLYTSITGGQASPARRPRRPAPRPPNQAHTGGGNRGFSLGLYDRLRGSYLDHDKCPLEWNTEDHVPVGGSSVATFKLVCKNRTEYQFQTSDNLHCSVTHTSSSTVVPHVVEPSPLTGQCFVKISFTTRTSGEYLVDIKINGKRLSRGPFKRHFNPGPVDASKTVFIDQTAVVVVTKGLYSAMRIIPRDSFDNTAVVSQNQLTVEIHKNSASGPVINPECVVDQEEPNRYELLLKVEEAGYFVGCVKYGGQVIGPNSFSIISLTPQDAAEVETNIKKKSLNIWYEAQMSTTRGKAKTVYCYISPRQLQVREYFLKIIPTRVFTCKVCPSTRIVFDPEPGKFILDDSYQEPVQLTSPSRDILAATFYKFVLKNIGGSEKFQDKQTFFYNELRKHHSKHSRSDQKVFVSRFNLLESARKATKKFTTSNWCRKFVVTFDGEEGLDWGGVSRELFQLLSVECFDVSNGLFTSFNKENMQALVHPNPNRPAHLQLKHFEFAGKLVGKCLYESACGNSLMVKARFSRSFLAQIIGLRINYKYFSTDDPDLFTTKIQYIRENDVTDLGVVFAEDEYDSDKHCSQVVPLKENGADEEVTEDNKMEYLDLLAQYRLAKSVKDEIEAFLKGLNEIVPDNLLSIFDENELELLTCGMGRVSFDDLKTNAVISGHSSRFQIVLSWFWTIVSSFTQEEMAKLLQFVTGCSQLPAGGFSELTPKFQITSSPTRGRLPTAHTCFNQLCLPDYDSCEQFQTSLMLALNEGAEGFGMI